MHDAVADEGMLSAGQAARELGISLDTLRRWDRAGKIRVVRDAGNRRMVPGSEIRRLRPRDAQTVSARNHLPGTVRSVEVEGLLAQVEIDVPGPVRIVAVITRDAARQLGLRPGVAAAGVVKATSVIVER